MFLWEYVGVTLREARELLGPLGSMPEGLSSVTAADSISCAQLVCTVGGSWQEAN